MAARCEHRPGSLGSGYTNPFDINERGQIVGASGTGTNIHAFLWQRGTLTDLGTLGGGNSEALAINERGQIVGHSTGEDGQPRAFLWERGGMTDLGTLGGVTVALDINESGQVVLATPRWTDSNTRSCGSGAL